MIVTVEPTSDKAAVVEKKAEMEVMVPALGMENAKFVSVPAALVRSCLLYTSMWTQGKNVRIIFIQRASVWKNCPIP